MLVLVACNFLWAGTYVAGKVALRSLSPIELNCLRFAIAGLAFGPFLWRARHSFDWSGSALRRLAFLCLLGFVLNKAAEFGGLDLTTASDTALLIAGEGLFTAVFGWLLLRETVGPSLVVGLIVSLFGVYLVIERGLTLPRLGGGLHVLGDGLVIGALVFEALYSVLGKATLERSSTLLVTAGCVIGSLGVWVPAAAVNIALAGVPHPTLATWGGVLYLAIAGATLAYVGWIAALRHVPASVAAPTLFLQPLVGAILAVVVLGERLQVGTIAGGVLIVVGIAVVTRSQRQAEELVDSAEVLA